jgi:hypothetical protein
MPLQQNLNYAEYGLQVCRERYAYGALNRKSTYDKYRAEEAYLEQIALQSRYRELLELVAIKSGKLSVAEKDEMETLENYLKGGFCTELAIFTKKIILERYPDALVEIVDCGDAHAGVLIGRNKESDSNDSATWDEQAIICDSWAEIIYPITEFANKQQGENIPFFRKIKSSECIVEPNHYLVGVLRISPLDRYVSHTTSGPSTVTPPPAINILESDSPAALYENGFNHYGIEDYLNSRVLFEAAVNAFGRKPTISNLLAIASCYQHIYYCCLYLGEYSKAQTVIDKALIINSQLLAPGHEQTHVTIKLQKIIKDLLAKPTIKPRSDAILQLHQAREEANRPLRLSM